MGNGTQQDERDYSSKESLLRELAKASRIDALWRQFLPVQQFNRLGIDSALETVECKGLAAVKGKDLSGDIEVPGAEIVAWFKFRAKWWHLYTAHCTDSRSFEYWSLVSDGHRWSTFVWRGEYADPDGEVRSLCVAKPSDEPLFMPDLVLSEVDQLRIQQCLTEHFRGV